MTHPSLLKQGTGRGAEVPKRRLRAPLRCHALRQAPITGPAAQSPPHCSLYPPQISPEEEERRRVRRERNKLAAAKCRNRRKELTDFLQAVSTGECGGCPGPGPPNPRRPPVPKSPRGRRGRRYMKSPPPPRLPVGGALRRGKSD